MDAPARLKKLIQQLRELQRQDLTRDELLLQTRRGQKKEAGKTYALLVIHTPTKDQPVTSETFPLRARPEEITAGAAARRQLFAALQYQERRSRPSVAALSAIGRGGPTFKELKNDLSVRPIYHQLETRIEAHIFIAFLAYLSAGHAETAAEDAGAGINGEGSARKTRHHADDRCRTAHDGRSGGRLVPLYGAGEGSAAPASTLKLQLPAEPPPKITARNSRDIVSAHPCRADL